MTTVECNADEGHSCDADEGEPCPSCLAEMAYWKRQFDATTPQMRRLDRVTDESRQELNAELIDAGRGHLIRQ